MIFNDWLMTAGNLELAHVPLTRWAIALAAALVSYLLMHLCLRLATRQMTRFADQHENWFNQLGVEVLRGTRISLLMVIALLIGARLLDLPPVWHHRVGQLWFVVFALQFGLWLNRAVSLGLQRYYLHHTTTAPVRLSATATLISWALRTLLWSLVVLSVLSNLGVNITAFVTSLGVGGIAVALAAQNILGDLFASVAIAVDKPFEVGDSISIGSMSGTVERLGLKTTRIRSLGGEQIIMSNTDLLKQTISNFNRLQTRRVVFKFGIAYDTPADLAQALPARLSAIISAIPQVRFDRAHLRAFGECSIEYEVIFTVLDPSYQLYMDAQQTAHLELMRTLAELDVRIAPLKMNING